MNLEIFYPFSLLLTFFLPGNVKISSLGYKWKTQGQEWNENILASVTDVLLSNLMNLCNSVEVYPLDIWIFRYF